MFKQSQVSSLARIRKCEGCKVNDFFERERNDTSGSFREKVVMVVVRVGEKEIT
jgi:hypothetical protein